MHCLGRYRRVVYSYTVIMVLALLSCNQLAAATQSFDHDLVLLRQYDKPIILKSKNLQAQIVVSPKFQGRVITSTGLGKNGPSNGWIDVKSLAKGGSPGGEDRVWLGPIGSQYSLYYPQKKPIVSKNWRVPSALLEENYPIQEQSERHIRLSKSLHVANHQGTKFEAHLTRTITLNTNSEIEKSLSVELNNNVAAVGYSVKNALRNTGKNWQASKGLMTLWTLSMLKGTDSAIAIFPLTRRKNQINEHTINSIHRYLYPLNKQRIRIVNNTVFVKADGRYRSKIGIPKELSKNIIASYTPELERLSIITFSFDGLGQYPVGLEQKVAANHPGDVSNIYNHGNMDGSLFDKSEFYEMETAAPMKALRAGETIIHTQQTVHFYGKPQHLNPVSQKLLGINIQQISQTFNAK